MGRVSRNTYNTVRPVCKTCMKRTTDFEYVNGAAQCKSCMKKISEQNKRNGKALNTEYYRQLRKSLGLEVL